MIVGRRVVVFAVAGAVALACGGNVDESSPDDAPPAPTRDAGASNDDDVVDAGGQGEPPMTDEITRDDVAWYFERFGEVDCGLLRACMEEHYPPGTFAGQTASCAENRAARWEIAIDPTFDAIERGTLIYRPDKAADCFAEIVRLGCAPAFERVPACDGVFEGTVELGGDCETRSECAGDRACDRENLCPGTCVEAAREGDPCPIGCGDGLFCDPTTERCVILGEEGDDCGGGVAPRCNNFLLCIGDDDELGVPGRCTLPRDMFTAPIAAPCDLTLGPYCAAGGHCVVVDVDALGNLVTECAPPAAAGAPCQAGFPEPCPEGYACTGPFAYPAEGACLPLPDTPGAECGGLTYSCAVSLICGSDDRCHDPVRIGEACLSDDDCWLGSCVDGVCALEGNACSG